MVREVSPTTLKELIQQSTSMVLLECLTIEHPGLVAPLRLVNDRVNSLVRSSGTYEPFPFKVKPPDDIPDQMPKITLTMDAVDQTVILALRALSPSSKPTVTYEVVPSTSPDTVEYGPLPMSLDGWSVDRMAIMTLELGFHKGLLAAPFPAGRMTPSKAKDV